jgi:hypothetical protein
MLAPGAATRRRGGKLWGAAGARPLLPRGRPRRLTPLLPSLQGLEWMLRRERRGDALGRGLLQLHPMWLSFATEEGFVFYLHRWARQHPHRRAYNSGGRLRHAGRRAAAPRPGSEALICCQRCTPAPARTRARAPPPRRQDVTALPHHAFLVCARRRHLVSARGPGAPFFSVGIVLGDSALWEARVEGLLSARCSACLVRAWLLCAGASGTLLLPMLLRATRTLAAAASSATPWAWVSRGMADPRPPAAPPPPRACSPPLSLLGLKLACPASQAPAPSLLKPAARLPWLPLPLLPPGKTLQMLMTVLAHPAPTGKALERCVPPPGRFCAPATRSCACHERPHGLPLRAWKPPTL